ncbi:hypothetical protein KTR10_00730 [Candidatus Kaiserbacteria bacterium]|nr:hypothetical protein [Candidatus Kaiserbacteria bacterium]
MKSFDNDITKIAEKTRLKAAERRMLRDRVLSYMEYHPLPETMREKRTEVPSFNVGEVLAWSQSHTRSLAGAFMAVFVVLVLPFAAEKAVPGDVLYPIKTKINESILASFADSPYEKVAFETELLERRIAEARLLAKEGKLNEETDAKIAETVKGHASAVQEGINELKNSDAEEAAIAEIAFSSTLEVQSAVLSSDEARGVGGSSEGVAGVLRDAQSAVSTSTPSYERLNTRVHEEITRVEDLFAAINGSVTDEERTDIERRLGDIEKKVETAHLAHEADTATSTGTTTPVVAEEEKVNPISILATTLRDIQKLVLFITDIDVRESVLLEDLVPAEKTDEERTTAILGALDELMNARNAFELDEEDTDIASTTTAFDSSVETASSTLAEKDFDTAEEAVEAAKGYLESLKMLLEEAKEVVEEEDTIEDETETATTTDAVVE